ncbi:hypothetical protein FJY94_06080 [Candidatus Kaiserbacteria bacterium]|nr:hypothetical protein [Candidatus Kaiserbacteria bacterium]
MTSSTSKPVDALASGRPSGEQIGRVLVNYALAGRDDDRVGEKCVLRSVTTITVKDRERLPGVDVLSLRLVSSMINSLTPQARDADRAICVSARVIGPAASFGSHCSDRSGVGKSVGRD